MKKIVSIICVTALMLSMMMSGITSLSAFAATTIDVTSFGVVANDILAASSNASKLSSSMSTCSKATTFYFPNGTYYIAPSSSSGMILSNKSNITLEGDNATIVNTSYDNTKKSQQSNTFMVKASNCTNLTIKGLNFDYQDYTSVSGTITATAGDSITIQLDDKFLNGSYKNALTGGEFIQCLNQLDDNGTPVCEHFAKYTSTGFTGTLSGNKYTITGEGYGSWYYFSVGKTLVVRFSLGTGAVPAFQLTSVKGLTVEDVNVYSTPADVFYCTGSNSDYSFTRLNVGPKADAPTYWGSNVDGIHLLGISGEINIDNCSFKGMGDDALNSHSRAAKVTATGTNSVTVVDGWSSGSLESTWGSAGDVVRFYKDDWTLLGTATITSFSSYSKSLKVDSLPSGVTSGCFVQNTKFMPKITIKDTVVDGSRARAFLIRSENVSITGCTVKNTRLAAVIMAADISKWFEMGPSANVTIDNNIFQNCCVSKVNSNYGVVAIKGCDDGGGDNYAAGVHNNITITNNVFNGSGASSIYASATDGLTIKGNTFANYGRDPHEGASTTGSYAVAVVNCNNVTMDYDESLYSRNASITQVEPENGGDNGEGGESGGEGGEEGGEDTEEPSALDNEIASIVVNEYDSLVGFDNTGDETQAANWTVLASAGDQKFANWGGLDNWVKTTMSADIKLQNKNELKLSDGFKFQMATTFNPDATLFNSTGHYFMFGDLKLLVDCGQNLAGSRTAGIYIYDGDTLVASADTGYAANDATFKSYYMARNTYYYITYTGGKMSVQTKNSNGTHDLVWKLADGTENVSAVPVTITADDKLIEVFKFGGWAQYQAGSTVLCDPALSGTFPYSTVAAFTTYLSGLDSDSTTEQVARARALFDKVKSVGSMELVAAVAPYESYIIACEDGGSGEGGEGGEGGDDVTDTTDSGNMPSSFFTADKWSTSDKRLVFKMSDGSVKFDDAASASVGNFINSGFTTQFKAVGGWEIELRNTSSSTNNGYVLGYSQIKYAAEDASRIIYIRKNGSDVQLARVVAGDTCFTENEWHTLGVYFDDESGKTTIRVYIDGVRVKFGAGYTHEYPDSFVNTAIENGNFVDFDPIQRGNYFEINPYFSDAVAGYGSMSFRSIDATETDHLYTIAAVGDSITQGACATGRGYSYPAELQRILGTDKFNVVNFGRSGATLMSNTGAPYNIQNSYYRSLSFAADYTVIMLGTNDSVDNYWNMDWSAYQDYDHPSTAKFEAELRQLIADYTAVGSRVIIMTSPASHNQYYTNVDAIVAIQKAVANDLGLDVIDMNAFTTAYGNDWQTYYDADGLHFNDAGYKKAAEYIADYFETLAQKADTAVTTPDESAEIALDKDVTLPYSATISEGDFAGFRFWYSNNTMTMLIGASGAEAWAYTNGRFDLGKNFNVSVTVENNTNPSSTYAADGDFNGIKYSSLSVGALEMRIRPLKNAGGVKSFLYDLYMNGVKIGSSFVDSGNTAPAARLTYNIRFINGYIAVTRSDDVSIITVTPEAYNAVRGTADYTFDDVRIGFGTFELGAYHRVASISAEKFADTNVEYSITATEGGKIMEGDTEFDGTKDYLVGETVTLTAVADDSHLFVGWINGDGELLSKDAEYTVIFEPDTEIVAKFIEKQISGMVISATTGGKITENGADFVMGDRLVSTSATIRAVAAMDGYKFAYWELNGIIVSREAEYTITFTEEGTLTAVFATPLDQEMLSAMVTVENSFDAADWTVTGDGAKITDGKIYAGNGSNQNTITAVYNTTLDLSSGFVFSTKFTWAYSNQNGYNNGNVNYWGDKATFYFGNLKMQIANSHGGNKTPIIFTLYNGDAVIGTYDTGYVAANYSGYNSAVEEYLNSTFTITYDGTTVKVFSSSLDANNDGTAGEYIVWTVSGTETTENVTVGNIDLTEATIKLEKGWGGSNLKNVEYFADLLIKGGLPFATVAEFNAFLNELNNEPDAATVALAREYYDAVSDEIKAKLDAAPALFAAEAALNGETIDAVYDIIAENGAVYVGNKLLDDAGVQYGETVILSAVETGDKGFTGWYDSEGNLITTEADLEVKFINTVRLTALFDSEVAEKEDSAMTVIFTEGGKITENGVDYVAGGNKVGDKAILTAVVTESAYQFGYWLLNGDIVSYKATYTLTYEAQGELIAVFTEYVSEVTSGYVVDDWTVTGDNAHITDGKIYAGNGSNQNSITAVYNNVLNLSAGFVFSTKFTWAYGTNGYNYNVNYWGDKSTFYFGNLKMQIANSNGNSKTPIVFTLYNGDAVIGTYDTGYAASNGTYTTAIEEYLNSTFTITYDGSTVKVFSSSLDANNDGVAGEYIVWTVSGTETTEAVTVGDINLSEATIKLEKGWGGSNLKNVEYFADLVIETAASHTVSVKGRQSNSTSMEVANGTSIVLSNVAPSSYGYKVVGWTDGDGRRILTDTVIVTEAITLKPIFEVADEHKGYVVTVTGASNTEGGTYQYNEQITLEFDSSVLGEGEYFGGWINAATGAVISYEETYSFYVGADTTISALISQEEAVSKPVVAITDVCDMNGDGSRWSFLMERTVPEGYTYVGSGFVYGVTEFATPADATHKREAQSASANGQFRVTINLVKATDVYMLAYLTYADAEGNKITIYSNNGTPVHCQKG